MASDREVPEVKHLPEAKVRGDYFWNSLSPQALLRVKINMYIYIYIYIYSQCSNLILLPVTVF
jgi:hypothetical protein